MLAIYFMNPTTNLSSNTFLAMHFYKNSRKWLEAYILKLANY